VEALMLLQCAIRLPRDVELVTDFRHDVDRALRDDLGVGAADRADVGLVVSEVCTNVLTHLTRGDQYDVELLADGQACVIEVHEVTAGRRGEPPGGNALAHSGSGLRIVAGVAASLQVNDEDHPGLLRRVRVEFAAPAGAAG
jgi:anti-sigma regulatory factor (Ser/Thr protein kinase)